MYIQVLVLKGPLREAWRLVHNLRQQKRWRFSSQPAFKQRGSLCLAHRNIVHGEHLDRWLLGNAVNGFSVASVALHRVILIIFLCLLSLLLCVPDPNLPPMNTPSPYSLQLWRWKQHVPSKHWQHYLHPQSVKIQGQNQHQWWIAQFYSRL